MRRWLQEVALGALEYHCKRHLRTSWGGAFNGQEFRRRIFRDLLETVPFGAIIETGTYRGTSTEYLQKTSGLPVYTVEMNARCYGFVRARFMFNHSVHCHQGDSRVFLRRVVPLVSEAPALFYLDAHWESDLPLREEVEIVFEGHPRAVVMIDDFQVPGDSGYAFDDYGDGKALTLDYLRAPLERLALQGYFPACHSSHETGFKRGCVVLARDPILVDRISGISTLQSALRG